MPADSPPRRQAHRAAHSRRRWFGYLVAVAVTALAAYLLYRTLSQYEWSELVDAVTAISAQRLFAALGFSALSYLTLTGFDWLALRHVGHRLSYGKVATASFTSLSIGHTLGLAALSSGAIRYRFYSRWGLRGGEVAEVIVFCGVTVGLGLALLGGAALLFAPDIAVNAFGLGRGVVRVAAAVALAGPVVYLVMAALIRRPFSIRGREIRMPALKFALAQVALGSLNYVFLAAALHQAVLSIADIGYLPVAAAAVSANVATIITHVPGGLGVVEAVLVYLLPGRELIGPILIFRFVYFLVPLCFGLATLGLSELLLSRARPKRARRDQSR
ncbi:lysylphosphatidylglycerol synthase domain-containing protein [Roseovarius spongiae]|uniref:lysylphosphatidylglycerol synthase domain-containing protein n=1 Tax=Roseovarius spongiae TaxID=2320272 RepID=UPI0019817180|nr:lysylphosphatidylglycerol synthase domain-containing protein [Roseovarius spongiae]